MTLFWELWRILAVWNDWLAGLCSGDGRTKTIVAAFMSDERKRLRALAGGVGW